ncbi:Arc family DNA-binding protein [Ancylobacter amanitiformis]|uniref:Arc-like DNA binding domain-containing protein n=1 Tax=Ancylobacter amanitiformis TaxID=217069 RepID=A0ABU0LVJ6_9HYPH|nr:Arc family DNA-binding protein [Ancylobacter amanitiformis]MDQ0512710.1 hypothetical protein [Ancylobacter amanitiformis]
MAKDDPHFRLRIPPSLKAQIEWEAKLNDRSINAEIISRIESSAFGSSPYTRRVINEINNLSSILEIKDDLIDALLKYVDIIINETEYPVGFREDIKNEVRILMDRDVSYRPKRAPDENQQDRQSEMKFPE